MSEQIVVFFDALGRTILGKPVSETPTTIEVQNPAVLHAGLNNEGKIQVNLIPAFFREFLKDWNTPLLFTYRLENIIKETSGIVLDDKLVAQYNSMWQPRPPREEVKKIVRELKPVDTEAQPVERLNLFDEVKPAVDAVATPVDTVTAPVSS